MEPDFAPVAELSFPGRRRKGSAATNPQAVQLHQFDLLGKDDSGDRRSAQPAPLCARGFGERYRLCARHARANRIRRGAVRGRRRILILERSRAFPRALRVPEQLQSTDRLDQTAKGGTPRMGATGGTEDPDVNVQARRQMAWVEQS